MRTIDIGTKVKSSDGKKYEVINVWDGGRIDIRALQPYCSITMPHYFPTLLSVRIEDYKIID